MQRHVLVATALLHCGTLGCRAQSCGLSLFSDDAPDTPADVATGEHLTRDDYESLVEWYAELGIPPDKVERDTSNSRLVCGNCVAARGKRRTTKFATSTSTRPINKPVELRVAVEVERVRAHPQRRLVEGEKGYGEAKPGDSTSPRSRNVASLRRSKPASNEVLMTLARETESNAYHLSAGPDTYQLTRQNVARTCSGSLVVFFASVGLLFGVFMVVIGATSTEWAAVLVGIAISIPGWLGPVANDRLIRAMDRKCAVARIGARHRVFRTSAW